MSAALLLTIDVDGTAGLPDGGRAYAQRLSAGSERLYGITRGLPRILQALGDARAAATFFLPGITAQRHPEAVVAISERGHEIALHGHSHRRLDTLDELGQREDLEQGVAVLESMTGGLPSGYRAPCWELTAYTLDLLGRHAFAYDSSLMGDDRPYLVGAGARELVELPVHWSLDDAPHFAAGGDAATLAFAWCRELELAMTEERPLLVTLHPEILGRPHRLDVLHRLLEAATEARCPFRRADELARQLSPGRRADPTAARPAPAPRE
jgi:peptidoglycan-N-acetylglucosamine deacetylase